MATDKKDNVILTKSFQFACDIIDLNKLLIEAKQFEIAKQVIRSGTSIGANIREAQRAVSKPDFINKLGIALKEADETQYWFELIEAKIFKLNDKLKKELEEIISLLVVIINSSKKTV
ncbi:MAG: hypothetical protein POELPBGB_01724 [Bacteroidia bacterium]|nr:hypothetical protein [Bacteroidia bacterium]